MRVRVRLFAMQREMAGTREVALELPDGATVEDAWAALVDLHPGLAPGRSVVRFAVNADYADASTVLADGDEVACIPPVSGGSGELEGAAEPVVAGAAEPVVERAAMQAGEKVADRGTARILELRAEPFGAEILAELADRLATPADGAVVGFIGRTRESAGTPAPGQEADAARFEGRLVEWLEYEALEPLALRVFAQIADEVAARFGVHRLAIVHRTGAVPLGGASVAIVAVSPHRGEAFDAARHAMDEVKARAPIWKAEHFADGHVWIGEPARHAPEGG